MGLTQHQHAVATIQEIVNLLLLRGNIGRPGAGAVPGARPQNVQGDRTMGIYEQPARRVPRRASARSSASRRRATPGLDTVDAIEAMATARSTCSSRWAATSCRRRPTPSARRAALRSCGSPRTSRPSSTARTCIAASTALILPCLGRTELDVQAAGPQFVTVEDSMSMVHRSQGVAGPAGSPTLLQRAGDRRAARRGALLGEAGRRLGTSWSPDYDRIRDHIARGRARASSDFNERVRAPGGFAAAERRARPHVPHRRRPRPVHASHPLATVALPPGRLLLMTIRSHDQYNTTIYGLDDRYRGIHQGRASCS